VAGATTTFAGAASAIDRNDGIACDTTMVIALGTDALISALSAPLVLEYEGVADRMLAEAAVSAVDLWRPTLAAPKDDMVLELAVDAGAPVIVTFNVRDFIGADRFGVRAITPREYLQEIGDIP
jgi:hypothetical protein